jgi:NitT/TauT family transport system permease protein
MLNDVSKVTAAPPESGVVPPPQAPQPRAARRKINWHLNRWVFLLSLVLLIGFWALYVEIAKPPSYILPSPGRVWQALSTGFTRGFGDKGGYWFHLSATLFGALSGYLLGCTIGIVLGILVSEFKPVETVLLPYLVGLQSLPKVAIAPLIIIWFGFGQTSKIMLAGLLCFFPLLMNTYTGLKLVDRDYILLMRSLKANRWLLLTKVKFPAALPLIFAGLDISIVYCVLGAIVAEFVGSDAGVGVMILQAQFTNDTASVFAALIILGATGIILHMIIQTIGNKVVFWTRRNEQVKVGP